MIINTVSQAIESSGILKEMDFGVKAENMGVIFQILRNQIYSDKPTAIIRELSCNGKDAHKEAGKADVPLKVTFPSRFEPTLKIRDFGFGLSKEEVQEVFVNYGSSTKRNSNDLIGSYGIGSKSPFSYTDSFTVNSYQNGVLCSYGLFIDESQRGKMSLMAEVPTDQPDGLEVIVPVNNVDISDFKMKGANFFKFWDIMPEFENLDDHYRDLIKKFRDKVPLFSGPNWKVSSEGDSYAIMGGVPYPLNNPSALGAVGKAAAISNRSLLLTFNIGDLDVVASRENIEYTQKSKRAITNLLESIYEDVKKDIENKFASCKTMWEAKALHAQVFGCSGKYHAFSSLFSGNIKWNNIEIRHAYFTFSSGFSRYIHAYERKRGSNRNSVVKVRRSTVYNIECHEKYIMVINDTGLDRYMNRIVPVIEEDRYKVVYLFEGNATIWDTFAKETGWDGPVLKLSELPKVDLQKYYPHTGASKAIYAQNNRIKTLTLITSYTNRHRRNASSYWSSSSVNPATDAFIYLPVKSYLIELGKKGSNDYVKPYHLDIWFELLRQAGISVPTIIGVKPSGMKAALANPKAVNFYDWAHQEVKNLIDNTKYLCDYKHYKTLDSDLQIDSISKAKPLLSLLDPELDLSLFCKRVNNIAQSETILSAILDLSEKMNIAISPPKTIIDDELKELRAKYPLLFRFSGCLGQSMANGLAQEFADYISLKHENKI